METSSGAAPSALTPAATAAAPPARVVYLIVTPGVGGDGAGDAAGAAALPSAACAQVGQVGQRYTRDATRALLQLLGIKPRIAAKIMGAVFAAVEAAVASGGGAGGAVGGACATTARDGSSSNPPSSSSNGASASSSVAGILSAYRVMPHGASGCAVALPRPQFCALLSACAAQHNYRIGSASDELRVACGWVLLLGGGGERLVRRA